MHKLLQPGIYTCNLAKGDLATVKTHPWDVLLVVLKTCFPSGGGDGRFMQRVDFLFLL